MIMNGDTFGDHFLSTELLNIMFNVVIYVWFNGVAAPFFLIKNCLLSDVSDKYVLLVHGQELCDNKEIV